MILLTRSPFHSVRNEGEKTAPKATSDESFELFLYFLRASLVTGNNYGLWKIVLLFLLRSKRGHFIAMWNKWISDESENKLGYHITVSLWSENIKNLVNICAHWNCHAWKIQSLICFMKDKFWLTLPARHFAAGCRNYLFQFWKSSLRLSPSFQFLPQYNRGTSPSYVRNRRQQAEK